MFCYSSSTENRMIKLLIHNCHIKQITQINNHNLFDHILFLSFIFASPSSKYPKRTTEADLKLNKLLISFKWFSGWIYKRRRGDCNFNVYYIYRNLRLNLKFPISGTKAKLQRSATCLSQWPHFDWGKS